MPARSGSACRSSISTPDLYQLASSSRTPVVYPEAVRAFDVRQPLYGEDLERGDLRD
jgi:hypothetical protein